MTNEPPVDDSVDIKPHGWWMLDLVLAFIALENPCGQDELGEHFVCDLQCEGADETIDDI
jgi:hypothetical protein